MFMLRARAAKNWNSQVGLRAAIYLIRHPVGNEPQVMGDPSWSNTSGVGPEGDADFGTMPALRST